MKKLLLVFGFILTVTCVNAQAKDTVPTNTEAIISINQINEVLSELKKAMTIDDLPLYELILNRLQVKINEGVVEWRKKLKKKP